MHGRYLSNRPLMPYKMPNEHLNTGLHTRHRHCQYQIIPLYNVADDMIEIPHDEISTDILTLRYYYDDKDEINMSCSIQ